tara:strand:- start:2412 stop:2702 length:291 start_codon:yes stop_codon:yes gene_type:complete
MTESFKDLIDIINQQTNRVEDCMSDIDRAREISDASLIDKHWGDAKETEGKEYMVDVKFFVTASNISDAEKVVDRAINTAKLNELESWQVENIEEI